MVLWANPIAVILCREASSSATDFQGYAAEVKVLWLALGGRLAPLTVDAPGQGGRLRTHAIGQHRRGD